jgi:hypothetical protein
MSKWTTTAKTAETWRERIREWRASGKSAMQFAEGRDYSPKTLQYWEYRLRKADNPAFVKLVPRGASKPTTTEMVVEIGSARVRISRGFDAALFAEVVSALGRTSR